MSAAQTLVIGTRASALARWQSEWVQGALEGTWPGLACRLQLFTTTGDRVLDRPLPEIGGKGLFTAELEDALRAGTIDVAVHSLKDLPITDGPGLTIGAIVERADARDALICPAGHTLGTLPAGARVGTSSLRRAAQLRLARPDLLLLPLRGNVDTRLRKAQAGDYDAIVLAAAGLTRLGLQAAVTQFLPLDQMLPAPGQGALAVQCRADDAATLECLRSLDHAPTRAAVTAERAFLAGLGGGCAAPVAAFGKAEGDAELLLLGLVAAPDGSAAVRVSRVGSSAPALGQALAEEALAQGAGEWVKQ